MGTHYLMVVAEQPSEDALDPLLYNAMGTLLAKRGDYAGLSGQVQSNHMSSKSMEMWWTGRHGSPEGAPAAVAGEGHMECQNANSIEEQGPAPARSQQEPWGQNSATSDLSKNKSHSAPWIRPCVNWSGQLIKHTASQNSNQALSWAPTSAAIYYSSHRKSFIHR